MQVKVDEANGYTTYIGEAQDNVAESDAAWKLTCIKAIGTVTHISVLGQGQQSFIWDNRASYTYEEIPST